MEVIPGFPIFWLWEVLDGGYSRLSKLLTMSSTWWRLFQSSQSSDNKRYLMEVIPGFPIFWLWAYLMEVIPGFPIFWLWEVLGAGYSRLSNLLTMSPSWWRLFQAFQSSDYEWYLMEIIPGFPIFWLWEVLDGDYSRLSNLLIMSMYLMEVIPGFLIFWQWACTWWRLFQAFQSSDYDRTWWRLFQAF
jgi:hypothetical protein